MQQLVHKYKKNPSHKGFSLLEVLISLSIFAILSLSLIGGLVQTKNLVITNESDTLMNSALYNLIQNIQENPNLHQKNQEHTGFHPNGNDPTARWHVQPLTKASEEHYQGKIQYKIVPEEGAKTEGLYGVYIRLTEKTLSKESSQAYYFLIREK